MGLCSQPCPDIETRAFRSGVRLTRKESELLAILRQHPGQALPRHALLETVWVYRKGTRTRTLDVHICRLRRKLTPEASSRIKTVYRGGYLWSVTAEYLESKNPADRARSRRGLERSRGKPETR